MKHLLAIIILLGPLLIACDGADDVARPTTYEVTLRCDECAEIGMEINLWSNPERAGVAGSVPHNTRVTVMDARSYQGLLHYKVRAGSVTGWVSENFVAP